MYVETIDDCVRKFHQTWTYYDGKLVYWLSFDDSVDDNGKHCVTALWSAENGGPPHASGRFHQEKVKLIALDSGWYNAGTESLGKHVGHAVLVHRLAYRQNFKGVSGRTHRILSAFHFNPHWIQHHNVSNSAWSCRDVMEALLRPTYFSLDAAMHQVVAMRSVALSRDFAICLSHTPKYGVLLLSRFGYIGGIKGRDVVVHHQGSLQEVSDFVRRSQADYKVICPAP